MQLDLVVHGGSLQYLHPQESFLLYYTVDHTTVKG